MNERELETLLSDPTPPLVAALQRIPGDILILGVAGKMGPSLARLAVRASEVGKVVRRVVGVARFTDPAARKALEDSGITTLACDLLATFDSRKLIERLQTVDRDRLQRLPGKASESQRNSERTIWPIYIGHTE